MRRMVLAAMLLTGASTTWVAGEWYLFLPPTTPIGDGHHKKISADKPLSQWSQDVAFDSALACETSKIDRARGE